MQDRTGHFIRTVQVDQEEIITFNILSVKNSSKEIAGKKATYLNKLTVYTNLKSFSYGETAVAVFPHL